MNRLAAVTVVLAVVSLGCRTTHTVAYSYPQANPAMPGDCTASCSRLAQTDGRDSFVSCIRSCPGVTDREGSCGDLAPAPGFGCIDEERGKFSVGKTVVLTVVLGVIVLAGAAAAVGVAASQQR